MKSRILSWLALLFLALMSLGNAPDPKYVCAHKKAGDSCKSYMACMSGTCTRVDPCKVDPAHDETCLRCK